MSEKKGDLKSDSKEQTNLRAEDPPPSYSEACNEPKNAAYQRPATQPPRAQNTFYVKPDLVNISQANSEHLNPAYPEFQRNEAERWRQGDLPRTRQQFKHGAPLRHGFVNYKDKTGGKSFPGSGGASYNNAANS